jgi:hypothetical protein
MKFFTAAIVAVVLAISGASAVPAQNVSSAILSHRINNSTHIQDIVRRGSDGIDVIYCVRDNQEVSPATLEVPYMRI